MELHSKNDVLGPEELRIIASIMEMRTESIMTKITPTSSVINIFFSYLDLLCDVWWTILQKTYHKNCN